MMTSNGVLHWRCLSHRAACQASGSLAIVAGTGSMSAAGGAVGALLDESGAMDFVWVAFLLLGALGVILSIISAIARRMYVASSLRVALNYLEQGRPELVKATVVRLTEAGAQRDADLLLRLQSQGANEYLLP